MAAAEDAVEVEVLAEAETAIVARMVVSAGSRMVEVGERAVMKEVVIVAESGSSLAVAAPSMAEVVMLVEERRAAIATMAAVMAMSMPAVSAL